MQYKHVDNKIHGYFRVFKYTDNIGYISIRVISGTWVRVF